LNKITDLKSAAKGVNKKKFARGILKEFFTGVKQYSSTLKWGKDLFTLNF
jgi:hypothetical protein